MFPRALLRFCKYAYVSGGSSSFHVQESIPKTMVYNGHQSHLLIHSYDFLMNEQDCTSFHKYMKYKNKHGSFADYCRDCLDSLQELKVDTNTLESDDSKEIVDVHNENGRNVKKFRYNKRVNLVRDRKKTSLGHVPSKLSIDGGLQQCCAWCCQKSHGVGQIAHSRMGYKTTTCCAVCSSVPLCTVKRIDEQTCFELWHNASQLNNPCASDVELPLVQQHSNRKPPPVRRRSGDNPNARSKAVMTHAVQPRRSNRQT
jgi:hypothetical protein